jgi:DNA-binding NarL/FixJ family response regulator
MDYGGSEGSGAEDDKNAEADRNGSGVRRQEPPNGREPLGLAGDTVVASVILIEQRTFSRECIVQAFRSEGDFRVSAFANIEEWRSANEAAPPRPVLLLSFAGNSGDANSKQQIAGIVRSYTIPVVVMADDEDPACVAETLRSGARGYIPTSLSLSGASRALRFVADGGTFVPASSLLHAYQDIKRSGDQSGWQKSEIFTPRQAAVVESLCLGKPNKVIAYELNMCESTVKVHVRNIMKKLKVKNRTEVVIVAQKLRELRSPEDIPTVGVSFR